METFDDTLDGLFIELSIALKELHKRQSTEETRAFYFAELVSAMRPLLLLAKNEQKIESAWKFFDKVISTYNQKEDKSTKKRKERSQ